MNSQQALVDVVGRGQIRPKLFQIITEGHDKNFHPFVLVHSDQIFVLGDDDEGLLPAKVFVVPGGSLEAGAHLPFLGSFGRVGSRAVGRLEELVGEEDAALAQVANKGAEFAVVLPTDGGLKQNTSIWNEIGGINERAEFAVVLPTDGDLIF